MTDSNLDSDDLAKIESYIDHYGLANMLIALSEICGAKSEHIASNWQDAALAKRWATIEGHLGVIVPKAEGL